MAAVSVKRSTGVDSLSIESERLKNFTRLSNRTFKTEVKFKLCCMAGKVSVTSHTKVVKSSEAVHFDHL